MKSDLEPTEIKSVQQDKISYGRNWGKYPDDWRLSKYINPQSLPRREQRPCALKRPAR
jgi:hypothetical protein